MDKTTKLAIVVPIVILSIFAILMSTSFADVHYYEFGFLKRKSTGKVDSTTVYHSGRHLVGPDFGFKIYQADGHFILLDKIAIFTSDKLEVWLTASYLYFAREQELHLLHDNYDKYYEDIVTTNALDALKVAATSYSTDEVIGNRAQVEAALFKAVRERLGGICCEYDCEVDDSCELGCRPQSECKDTDRGLFVAVRYFQMQTVDMPEEVASRYLRSLVIQEETAKANFIQEEAVVIKETEAMVRNINNQAAEIHQNATATSELILAQAKANSTASIERARSEGLRDLYTKLGLSDEDYMSSFDYLRTIKDMQNAHLSVDFSQLIAGNF